VCSLALFRTRGDPISAKRTLGGEGARCADRTSSHQREEVEGRPARRGPPRAALVTGRYSRSAPRGAAAPVLLEVTLGRPRRWCAIAARVGIRRRLGHAVVAGGRRGRLDYIGRPLRLDDQDRPVRLLAIERGALSRGRRRDQQGRPAYSFSLRISGRASLSRFALGLDK
jgi:hypothetical protein